MEDKKMDTLHKVMDFCMRHQTILSRSIVSLLTVASELIFSYVAFECPCNSWNMVYGCSFLLVPAFILFVLDFMVNPKTWHLDCSPFGTLAHFCQVLVPMTAKASVAPLTWIAAALLGTNFYECAASGNSLAASHLCKDNGTDCRKQLPGMPCDETLSANISREELSLRAQSQLIGLLLITSVMTVALISKCVRYYFPQLNYLHLKVWKIYTKEEREFFFKKAKEHATKLAEGNTNCFFEATDPAPFHIPTKKDGEEISTMYIFDSQGRNYSTLHKYAKHKPRRGGQGRNVSAKGNEAGRSPVPANGNEAGRSPVSAKGNEAVRSPVPANGNEAGTSTVSAKGNEAVRSPVSANGNENETGV